MKFKLHEVVVSVTNPEDKVFIEDIYKDEYRVRFFGLGAGSGRQDKDKFEREYRLLTKLEKALQ